MEYQAYKQLFSNIFESNGLGELLNEDKIRLFYEFSDILAESNKSFNLTAITQEKDIILKHFTDCASVVKHIPNGANLIDVGCGAGFPSFPIAILRDDVKVTSLDSTAKKISFIRDTASLLKLQNVSAVCSRAEEFAIKNHESFDVCISRAVARLNILSELCIPLVKQGGLFIAMKSSMGEEEHAEAHLGIQKLGGELSERHLAPLSDGEVSISRETFIYRKIHATPKGFPRKYSQILKKPL